MEDDFRGLFYDNPGNGSTWFWGGEDLVEPWMHWSITAVNTPSDILCPTYKELELTKIPKAAEQWMYTNYGETVKAKQVIQADIDSDGDNEYLIVFDTTFAVKENKEIDPTYSYYIVLMIDGSNVTPLINDRLGPYNIEGEKCERERSSDWRSISVDGIYDFNNDGIFEICVSYGIWELHSKHVFSDGFEVLRARGGV
jgi:hypothetical protein